MCGVSAPGDGREKRGRESFFRLQNITPLNVVDVTTYCKVACEGRIALVLQGELGFCCRSGPDGFITEVHVYFPN